SLPSGAKIFKANGCKNCNYSGYTGRRPVSELLVIDDKIKDLLKTTIDEHSIKIALEAEGLKTTSLELNKMLLNGETSLDEAIRVGLGHA
ncbi:MAG: type II/IV secretion system protein, partial [Sulfurimonas sp.]|nr:type II/IV secretion system protein [Sulfurimonas sp.]